MTFSHDNILSVWAKGTVVDGNDPSLWRKDECGAWIFRSHYERRTSVYGWVIDRITPLSEGGTDELSNLRPLHWENTARKEDGTLVCSMTAQVHHDMESIPNN
ncbi:MAG: HNH endonuclease [Thaumarchaeota archaeon]|nr:MAG: HNH endonuclease [Nitrososphaerota archaeon]